MRTSSYVLRVVQRDGVVVELRDADPRWSVLELMSHVTTAAPRTRWARDEDDQRAPQLALVAAGDGLRRASSLADLGCPTTLHIVGSVADAADVVPDPIAYSARVCRTVISATDRAALAIWRAFLLRNSSFESGGAAIHMLGLVDTRDCVDFTCVSVDGVPNGVFGTRIGNGFLNGFALSEFVWRREMAEWRLPVNASGRLVAKFSTVPHPQALDALHAVYDERAEDVEVVSCWQLVLPSDSPCAQLPVPPGLTLRSLRDSDVARMALRWPYVRNNGEDYLPRCIAERPSVGLESDAGELVAFAITHSDNSIGALHVDDKWRRRGLGQLLVSALSVQYRAAAFDVVATQVVVTNEASLKLFESLGWKRTSQQVAWLLMAQE